MESHRQHVENYIQNDLPQSFVASEISEMYTNVQKDIELIKTGSPSVNQKHMEMMLHQRHKKLAFSYPGLFFKTVREEVDPNMLKSLLTLYKTKSRR